MKKKEDAEIDVMDYDDDIAVKEDSADLSEFDEYRPFEGKDDIDNLDDDFSSLRSSKKSLAEIKDEDISLDEIDSAVHEDNADDLLPEKEEKLVETIVIKKVEPKKALIKAAGSKPAEMDKYVKKQNGYIHEIHREKIRERESEIPEKKPAEEKLMPEPRAEKPVVRQIKSADKGGAEMKSKKIEPISEKSNGNNNRKSCKPVHVKKEAEVKKHSEKKIHHHGDESMHEKHIKKSRDKRNSKMVYMAVSLLALVALGIFLYTYNFQKKEVVAVVNGEEITKNYFDKQLSVFIFYQSIPDEIVRKIDKDAYLAILITETVIAQEAEKQGLGVSDAELDARMQEMLKNSPYTETTFKAEIISKNVDYDNYKTFVKRAMANEKILDWASRNYVVNDTKAIELYHQLFEGRIAAHILVCYAGSSACSGNGLPESEALAKANSIYQQSKTVDFATLAKENSDDTTTKETGGVFAQPVKRGNTVKEFEDKLFSMNEGEISEPIKTQYGFHIIKLYEITPKYETIKEDVKLGLYKSELKQKANVTFLIDTLNTQAVVVKDELTLCIEKNGAERDTIVFYYSDLHDASVEMKQITKILEALGYKFYYSEISENSWVDIMDCFKNRQSGIPQYICAGTGEVMLGKVNGAALRAFADKCKADVSKPAETK